MTEVDRQAEVLGEHGEPCGECGAPLATDQRYCLNCGRRRAGARVDYRSYMAPSAGERLVETHATSSLADPAPDQAERQGRDYAPFAAVGGIAVLGLMLLVGVLIGKGNATTAAPAPAPIVRVAGPSGGDTANSEPEGPQATAGKAKKTPRSKQVETGAKQVEGGLTGTAARNSGSTVQATTDDLEDLEGKSGESYEETVKKLPDKIATPGAPPPIDKTKAAGGGGAAETFE